MKPKILAYIPARAGSKRVPGKNIRKFLGRPLIAYTIDQAKACPIIDRIIVDTESPKIAAIAKKAGAEVPWLRPAKLAQDSSPVMDAMLHLLRRLKQEQSYVPDYLMILQATSPLREQKDIMDCWKEIQKPNVTSVLTVVPTHPKLYHLTKGNFTELVNGSEAGPSNTQGWPPAYLLNGCTVYIIKIPALLKEKRVITKKNKAVILPKWRSVDIDTPEEWVMAELFYKNKKNIISGIKKIYGKK